MSEFIRDGSDKHASRVIKAFDALKSLSQSYITKPDGVFGAVAKVKCGGVTIDSEELDMEFTVPFDDDLEPNEAEIIIYNLTNNTINQFKKGAEITIEAGYKGDTGVIFKGFVDRKQTSYEDTDKRTTIKCFDDIANKTVESIPYAARTKASYILKDLLVKAGLPIADFKPRRDHTYENEVTVDGDLMQNIKKYSEVCGVSTYTLKGKVYSRYIKHGDNINFELSVNTGMIGYPTAYEEEINAEEYTDTIKGYEVEMLLQHRMQTAAIININSVVTKGAYRVRSGEHRFSPSECITKIKVM